jgi:hypothetical protein
MCGGLADCYFYEITLRLHVGTLIVSAIFQGKNDCCIIIDYSKPETGII